MHHLHASLTAFGTSTPWLVVANLVLCALLVVWMVRYRRLSVKSRAEQANQRDLIENLSEGIYRSLPNGKQLSANKALVKLNGYDSEAEMLASIEDIGKEWYVEPGRRDEFRAALKRHGHVEDFVSEIYRHKTRERVWITESARLVHDNSGRPMFYEGSVREITETVRKLQAEELLRKLSSQVPGGLFQFARAAGGDFTICYLSDGFRRLTGYQGAEGPFSEMLFAEMVHPDDRPRFLETFRRSGLEMKAWDLEFRTGCGERWLRVNAMPEAVDGRIVWHGYINDVSVRKRNEMEIEQLAYYDALTELPNRRMCMDRMRKAIAGARARGDHGAVLFIDLDNFKTLNDSRGHDVGDRYLIQVGERLKACVGPRDLVGRIGGDEFVVILEGLGRRHAQAGAAGIFTANRLNAALREPFQLGYFCYEASASVGIVVFDGGETRAEDILKHADIAMYRAKAAGRDGVAMAEAPRMEDTPDARRSQAPAPTALTSRPLAQPARSARG